MQLPEATSDPLPVLFCLHFLGGSARSWNSVIGRLGGVARCVALDLPGFGDTASGAIQDVAGAADAVAAAIRRLAPARWMLAGHSMGAKIAVAVARRAEDGEAELDGLAGLVLIAGSPPGPEPMSEDQRQEMLGWFIGDAAASRAEADGYIRDNVSGELDDTAHQWAVDDVLRAAPAAWRAWLAHGSLEDWALRIGKLGTPTLIVAGADDADLGPDAQRRLTMPHFLQARLVTVPGAKHLLPLECPGQLADLIAGYLAGEPWSYRELIGSSRVSANTRALLLTRAVPDDPVYTPRAVEPGQLATLKALLDRVLPQPDPAIDLAARIDGQLADEAADGWRFAALPPDDAAYRAGLRTLDAAAGSAFADLDAGQRDAILQRAAAGDLAVVGTDVLDASQMKLWFEDVRSDAVRIYVAHPATLARMGYSGIGYGGDGEPKAGLHAVGPGEREPWEPDISA